jgi:hypothetical protein
VVLATQEALGLLDCDWKVGSESCGDTCEEPRQDQAEIGEFSWCRVGSVIECGFVERLRRTSNFGMNSGMNIAISFNSRFAVI